ncbi:MAG: GW dipeptide domain-containing protein [Bacteroidales bacterium]|nr:GW dipeptide domain-containing protein [Bacteroidales bacterium]MCF6342085.1 GW dipeptide domain-containing protein [Bacteroidales bacterium]
MKVKAKVFLIMWAALLLTMVACDSGTEKNSKNYLLDNPKLREVEVTEIVQTSSYTYLKLKEENAVYWGAVPLTTDIKEGETYYFDSFLEMNDFPSKELNKTFESIYFIDLISDKPFPSAKKVRQQKQGSQMGNQMGTAKVGQQEVQAVTPAQGGITIGELYANKEKYNGKTVKIKGKVVKYTEAVMNKNWAHIQDGSHSGNDFDLTVTTLGTTHVGDVVTFEGKITLNKDFGYGYNYPVLMEDATILASEHAH